MKNTITSLSALALTLLISSCGEKKKETPAAPAAPAAPAETVPTPPAPEPEAAPEPEPEPEPEPVVIAPSFAVEVVEAELNKNVIAFVKLIRKYNEGIQLRDARKLHKKPPFTIITGATEEECQAIKAEVEALGGKAVIKEVK